MNSVTKKRITSQDVTQAISFMCSALQADAATTARSVRPPEKSVLYKLWRSRKLTYRTALAATKVYEDMLAAAGTSSGMVSSYSERVDVSTHKTTLPSCNAELTRFVGLVNFLPPSQRKLLFVVLRDIHQNLRGGSLDPKMLGSILGHYRQAESAYANGVGHLQALLLSVADYYGL